MFKDEGAHRYDDIINLPHYQSKTRPHMSVYDRAAQFSPFAALTGYEDAVKETARLTDQRIELSEEVKSVLSVKLIMLREHISEQPEINVTYFVADEKKSGGCYVTEGGFARKIDEYNDVIIFKNQLIIPIDDILEISGDLFVEIED